MTIRLATFAATLAATVAVSLTTLITTAPAAVAQVPTCAGTFENTSRAVARGPEQKRIMRHVQRIAPSEWSAAVTKSCPRLNPSWSRAKSRKTACGFFSSSMRYTCTLTATPALKRR
jgi:hypothetical protein